MSLWKRWVAAALALALLIAATACGDPGDPHDNDHARRCVVAGGHIHSNSQFGGKWDTHTYWCRDQDGNITDIWE